MVEKSSGIFNIVYSVGTNKCSNRISYLSDDNFGSGNRENAFISDCCWNNFIIEFSNILCYIKVRGSITVIAILVRLYIVKNLIDYSIRLFVEKVIVPIVLVSVVGIIFPYVVRNFYEESFGRLCLTISLAIVCSGVAIFIIGLTQHERLRILTYLEKKFV